MKVTQEEAFDVLVNTNDNVFLTGAGGCGKTKLINDFIAHCNQNNIKYGLTASTGIASQLINGVTVHSFLGLGAGEKPVNEIVSKSWFKKKIEPVIQGIDVLILDEISMFGTKMFELKNEILKYCLDYSKPSGGLRIIVVGDFFQLPPVNDEYCFLSPVFKEHKFTVLNLYKNYRATAEFWIDHLKHIRVGAITQEVRQFLLSRFTEKIPDDIIKIVSMNWEANKINKAEYEKIPGPEIDYIYSTKDPDGILTPVDIDNFFSSHVINKKISLKVGTRVMIKVNDTQFFTYVNGSMGEVVYIDKDEVIVELDIDQSQVSIKKKAFTIEKKEPNPDYKKKKGTVPEFIVKEAKIICMPLIYGYALTVHNCQGLTLESAAIDLSRGFADGQAYVALSRVKDPYKLFITGLPTRESLSVNPEVLRFIEENKDDFVKRKGEE